MNSRVYSIIELVLSAILIATGLIVSIQIDLLADYIMWVMIGFFLIKISIAFFKLLTFKISTTYTIVQIVLNVAVIALVIIFYEDPNALSYVIGSSCIIDLFSNLVKAITNRKKVNTESFFGIENIVCILFITLLFINNDSNMMTTGVLFGSLLIYKGMANLLSNMFVRRIFSLSDLGKALNVVHGLDVIFGLLIVLTLTSFILPYAEEGIETVGDAWWYCFAVVTTIGYGDLTVTSVMGRILSVIIGFYGIIIVSLMTSAIVVYINMVSEKEKQVETQMFQEERERHEARKAARAERHAKHAKLKAEKAAAAAKAKEEKAAAEAKAKEEKMAEKAKAKQPVETKNVVSTAVKKPAAKKPAPKKVEAPVEQVKVEAAPVEEVKEASKKPAASKKTSTKKVENK